MVEKLQAAATDLETLYQAAGYVVLWKTNRRIGNLVNIKS